MWSSIGASVVVVNLIATAAAHRRGGWDWVSGLPSCWGHCLNDNGCNSKRCICEASQDDDYLTGGVECMVRSCDADGMNVNLSFLAPLQMYCKATQDEIPSSMMSKAYACATTHTTSTAVGPSPTRRVEQSTRAHKTTEEAGNRLKSIITSTMTLTTTNADGKTVQLLIPIAMGPSTMTTGEIMTRTLESKSTWTQAATSDVQPAAEPTAAGPLPTQGSPSPSPTSRETNLGNGSPFDLSVSGETAHWSLSRGLAGAGVLLGVFARL